MKKRVLCLLADGVEELELVAPVDVLRRAGAEVVLAVLGDGLEVAGRNGLVLRGDVLLDDVPTEDFDLLLIPGGAAVAVLRQDERPAALARDFVAAGKPVAAICAGPLVLHDAGRRASASPRTFPWRGSFPAHKPASGSCRMASLSPRAGPARRSNSAWPSLIDFSARPRRRKSPAPSWLDWGRRGVLF